MGALLGDFALFYYKNLVCISDGGESVGDGDDGARPDNACNSILNLSLRLNVHRSRSLIKDNNRGLSENGTGNGNSLFPDSLSPRSPTTVS